MKSLVILGRQPELGLAELESLLGAHAIEPLGDGFCAINLDPSAFPFDRLGGSIKLARIITTLPTTEWRDTSEQITKYVLDEAEFMPDGKLTLGISTYGLYTNSKMIERTALSIKKLVKKSGRPVRIVPTKNTEISTPQIIHNNLTSDMGMELIAYKNGEQTIIARTTNVQDIESYAARDQARPKRDARVGMLPPKLAQIIINLAAGSTGTAPKSENHTAGSAQNITILDPFCGTGVILQEALLMGYGVYGTDIEPRMVDFTTQNLHWLHERYQSLIGSAVELAVGDATHYDWQLAKDKTLLIACEGYLGTPFTHTPEEKKLRETIDTCNVIMLKTLVNLSHQIASGTRLCIGMPCWFVDSKTKRLPLLQNIGKLGYSHIRFEHTPHGALMYHREGQLVGRDLIVLQKV